MHKTESHKIALCGVFSALSVVLLLAGNLIQVGTYAAPMLATFLLVPVLEEYGAKYAALMYLSVSFLSAFLVPDKELAFFYIVVMGYYPLLRQLINRRISFFPLRLAVKLAFFSAACCVLYALLFFLLMPELLASLTAEERGLLPALLGMGCISFLFYDLALRNFTALYHLRLKRLWKLR